jgi:hypothetical protein
MSETGRGLSSQNRGHLPDPYIALRMLVYGLKGYRILEIGHNKKGEAKARSDITEAFEN